MSSAVRDQHTLARSSLASAVGAMRYALDDLARLEDDARGLLQLEADSLEVAMLQCTARKRKRVGGRCPKERSQEADDFYVGGRQAPTWRTAHHQDN